MRLWRRSLKVPAYRLRWSERIGIFQGQGPKPGGIWIHAVSVGEIVAALPLINAILQQYPQLSLTVTTTTPTGSQRLLQSVGGKVFHIYAPYDLPWAMSRFIKLVQPRLAVIMETELWPNLLYVCNNAKIPVINANGRLSAHSLRGYLRIKPIIESMLKQITCVAAQSQLDADRFIQLGLPINNLQVCGNLKYDVQIPDVQKDLGIELKRNLPGRKILVAASTHPGEEEQVLTAFKNILTKVPECLLILVPRHPDRFEEVAKTLEREGFAYVRRSQDTECTDKTQVLLGDTMGELNIFYSSADLAFVGGSLVPFGGHNLLEPAAAGVATITGSDTSNFREITQKLLAADALCVIRNSTELSTRVLDLLSDPVLMAGMSKRGLAVVQQNQGATQKVIQIIDRQLSAMS